MKKWTLLAATPLLLLAAALAARGAVLAFATLTSVVAGLIFGAVPGLWIGGRTRSAALESASITLGARGRGWQRALVVAQVALSLVLGSKPTPPIPKP